MKKKWLIPVIVLILAIGIIGGNIIFDKMFPKAQPIDTLSIKNISSMKVSKDTSKFVKVKKSEYDMFLEFVNAAKPTRIGSSNDTPSVKSYVILKIYTPARDYSYYVYIKESKCFLEAPYIGIYEVDMQLYELISDILNDK